MGEKFSHIYIEKDIAEHDLTKKILARMANGSRIFIANYQEIFNRVDQDIVKQHEYQNLILAKKRGSNLYKGAPVCQSFGNQNFYYSSNILNCPFNCEYCYLKGMYRSAFLVIFVNIEDTFEEIEKKLAEEREELYISVSYDTDMLALENLTGFVEKWTEFVKEHEEVSIEIRTKSALGGFTLETTLIEDAPWKKRVIFAYTISPASVIKEYEKYSASLEERLLAAKKSMDAGYSVRLCFDPMIYVPNWKQEYESLVDIAFARGKQADELDMDSEKIMDAKINPEKLLDVSVGTFRISGDYLKNMRRALPDSKIVNFPFERVEGYFQYPPRMQGEMEEAMVKKIAQYVDEDKIFLWKED